MGNSFEKLAFAVGLIDENNERYDEYLGEAAYNQYELLKIANAAAANILPAVGKATWNLLANLAPAAALGVGIWGANKIMSAIKSSDLAKQHEDVFRYIQRHGKFHVDDPNLIRDAFDTLVAFAPSVAAKPLAAKSFVELAVNREGVDPDLLRQIASIQKDVSETEGRMGGGMRFPSVETLRDMGTAASVANKLTTDSRKWRIG